MKLSDYKKMVAEMPAIYDDYDVKTCPCDGNYDIDDLIAVVDDVKRETARLDSVTMHQDHHRENIYFGSVTVEGVNETIGCKDVPDVDIIFLGDEDDNYIADENGSYIYSWEVAES